MARKKKHEEHVNAEAWAIPYGDLVTLLFALFTVMYAMSSVNEGKFRVLSDSMIAAFHGAPKSTQPINVGTKEAGKGGDKELVGVTPTALMKIREQKTNLVGVLEPTNPPQGLGAESEGLPGTLVRMEHQVREAMKSLIDANMVSVRRENLWLEIEINTDILFPSGAGAFAPAAEPVLDKLAVVLKPFPNPIRVEGHTDDRPIRTAAFPSNWELSAARAASVVHQFTKQGVDPMRLEIVGYGEFRPRQPNLTAVGRNANRRVVVLVLEQVAPPAAGGVQTADSKEPQNAVVSPPASGAGDSTVLVKNQAPKGRSPAEPIGPSDLAWRGSASSEDKAPAPAPKHE